MDTYICMYIQVMCVFDETCVNVYVCVHVWIYVYVYICKQMNVSVSLFHQL